MEPLKHVKVIKYCLFDRFRITCVRLCHISLGWDISQIIIILTTDQSRWNEQIYQSQKQISLKMPKSQRRLMSQRFPLSSPINHLTIHLVTRNKYLSVLQVNPALWLRLSIFPTIRWTTRNVRHCFYLSHYIDSTAADIFRYFVLFNRTDSVEHQLVRNTAYTFDIHMHIPHALLQQHAACFYKFTVLFAAQLQSLGQGRARSGFSLFPVVCLSGAASYTSTLWITSADFFYCWSARKASEVF